MRLRFQVSGFKFQVQPPPVSEGKKGKGERRKVKGDDPRERKGSRQKEKG
jgi:hypothetical protein